MSKNKSKLFDRSDRQFVSPLRGLGLSLNEAMVYLALLRLEVARVQEIAKKTGLNRSSTYVVLASLKKLGLITVATGEGVKRFVAAPPEHLSWVARQRSDKYNLLRQNLTNLMPQLKSVQKSGKHKPRVKTYEGKPGLREAFKDSLGTKEGLLRVSSSVEDIFKNLEGYLPTYVQERFKRNLKMRGIHPDGPAVREMLKSQPKNFDELVLISPNEFKFLSDVAIYDDKVGFMSTKDLFSVIVESEEIAEVMKKLFDLAWLAARDIQVSQKH